MLELPADIEWPERTREWWQRWAESPITADWSPLQWEFLLDTALVHATVWGAGDMTKMSELRARITQMGGVPALDGAAPAKPRKKTAATAATAQKASTPLDELKARRQAKAAT